MESSKDSQPRTYSPLKSPTLQRHLRENINISYPKQFLSAHHQPFTKQILIGKDGFFRCAVDVHDFLPDEIQVKMAAHVLTISASHDERKDEHGLISRNLTKKYVLPPGLDVDKISVWISKEKNILYVKIPPTSDSLNERLVDIKIQD